MTNLKFLKTLTAGVALAMALYPQAWAASTCLSDEINVTCWECGNNCTARLDSNGKMTVSGSGDMVNVGRPWPVGQIKTVVIEEGITKVGYNAFWYAATETIVLANSVRSIDPGGFQDNSHLTTIIMGENSQLSSIPGAALDGINSVQVLCKGRVSICEAKKNLFKANNNIDAEFYYYEGPNEDGNYIEYSDNGLAIYTDSTKEKPLGKYDFEGNQTGVYKYDGAGNLTAAYENGVSTYKKTSYTPTEAAAAVKKGNHNTVTLTFK